MNSKHRNTNHTPNVSTTSSSSSTTSRPSEILSQLNKLSSISDPKRLQTLQNLQRTLSSTINVSSDLVKLYPEIINSIVWCLSEEKTIEQRQLKFQTLKYCLNYVRVINTNHHSIDELMLLLPYFRQCLKTVINGGTGVEAGVWLDKISYLIVKTMVCIPVKEYVKELIGFVNELLAQIHAEDQQRASKLRLQTLCISAIPRLYVIDPKLVLNSNVFGLVYDFLESQNLTIMIAALTVLNELNEMAAPLNDIQLQFNHDQAVWFLDVLMGSERGFIVEEVAKVQLLQGLMSYVPTSAADGADADDSEVWDTIHRVTPLLNSQNSAIVLHTLKLVLYLLNFSNTSPSAAATSTTSLHETVAKLTHAISTLLTHPHSPEIKFLTLRNVILLTLSKSTVFQTYDIPTLFFCAYDDPTYIKDTKLEILYLLSTASNLSHMILPELTIYARDIDVMMSRKAIRAIGNLAVKFPGSVKECVDVIKTLVEGQEVHHIYQECVVVMKNIFRRYDQQQEEEDAGADAELRAKLADVLHLLINNVDHLTDSEAKNSMIWIMGQYCGTVGISTAESILGLLTDQFELDPVELQLTALTAVVKLQIRYTQTNTSGQFVQLTRDLLTKTVQSTSNPDVRSRAVYYTRLLTNPTLQKQPSFIQDVLNSSNLPQITQDSENEKLDPGILEELELNMGTLASIYLKPVTMVFRLNRRKSINGKPQAEKWWVDFTNEANTSEESDGHSIISSLDESGFRSRSNSNFHSSQTSFHQSHRNSSVTGFGRVQDDDFRVSSASSSKNGTGSSSSDGSKTAKLGRKLSVVGRKFSLRR
ncbi:hypothetical protein WICPIJ_005779 [Wickerhamomyces pijperi]|uniref:Clathrin/coatomer adaptor adaptin-like N-terminal domain-containing protein n=1 Tax=Wickerhamomyces pijperi TaxID=599730 RepID=A0A9P8TLH9_WICPI|nr:hypothetical protein WICPIJ_005779 [Wickerhamomyces pijperi]